MAQNMNPEETSDFLFVSKLCIQYKTELNQNI